MKKVFSLILLFIVSVIFNSNIIAQPSVGYVLVGPKNDGGWSMRHHQGFQSLKKHGYKVSMVEMVPEGDKVAEKRFKKGATNISTYLRNMMDRRQHKLPKNHQEYMEREEWK